MLHFKNFTIYNENISENIYSDNNIKFNSVQEKFSELAILSQSKEHIIIAFLEDYLKT